MAIEAKTKTGSDVKYQVTRIFGDEASIQITDADILQFINRAQREIVLNNYELNRAVYSGVVTQGSVTIPATGIPDLLRLYAVMIGNKLISNVTLDEALRIRSQNPGLETGFPTAWYDFDNDIRLIPAPDQDYDYEVYYCKVPTELNDLSSTLDIPDSQFSQLINWVLKFCYELDEDIQKMQAKDSDIQNQIQASRMDNLGQHAEHYSIRSVDDSFSEGSGVETNGYYHEGSPGVEGAPGKDGSSITQADVNTFGSITFTRDDGTVIPLSGPSLKGPKGDKGSDGAGIPTGGSVGQVPARTSDGGSSWVNAVDVIPDATTSAPGRMTVADKVKLIESPYRGSFGFFARDFGAKGDGITDDSDALSFAASEAENSILHLEPYAVYVVNKKFILSDGITVEGNNSTLTKTGSSPSPLMFTKGTPSGKTGYGSGGKNITIRNCRVVGDYLNIDPENSGTAGDVTSAFHHVSGLTIDSCSFEQGMRNGHYLDLTACNDVKVINSSFIGANPITGREYIEAIQIDFSSYSSMSDKTEPPSTYDGLPTFDVSVSGCTFKPVTVGGTEYPMPCLLGNHSGARTDDSGYYSNILFYGNTCEGWVRPTTSFWAGWIHLSGIDGVTIRDNTFKHTGEAATAFRGIIVTRAIQSVTPEGQFSSSSPASQAYNRPCKNLSVMNNKFSGLANYFEPGSTGNAIISFIGGLSAVGSIIHGNKIDACNGMAVMLQTGKGDPVFVENNTFYSSGPIIISAPSSDCVISRNSVAATSDTSVSISTIGSTHYPVISENRTKGGSIGIQALSCDNGQVTGNLVQEYLNSGIVIGQDSGSTAYDVTVAMNRVRSTRRTSETKALDIRTTSARTFRYGNRLREGGILSDVGSGTISVATDQTS